VRLNRLVAVVTVSWLVVDCPRPRRQPWPRMVYNA
jgi:hypothetical protein